METDTFAFDLDAIVVENKEKTNEHSLKVMNYYLTFDISIYTNTLLLLLFFFLVLSAYHKATPNLIPLSACMHMRFKSK